MNLKRAKLLRFAAKHLSYDAVKKTLPETEVSKLTFDMLPKEIYKVLYNRKGLPGTIELVKPSWKYYYRYLKKRYANVEISGLTPTT
jgi:hypothetical protein